jgi:multiple sugar transport system ATP-binding protein
MAAAMTGDIVKKFDEVTAVKGISLAVPDGEFMVLLGPVGLAKRRSCRSSAGSKRRPLAMS